MHDVVHEGFFKFSVYERNLAASSVMKSNQDTFMVTVRNKSARQNDSKSFKLYSPQDTIFDIIQILENFCRKELEPKMKEHIMFEQTKNHTSHAIIITGTGYVGSKSFSIDVPFCDATTIANYLHKHVCNGADIR